MAGRYSMTKQVTNSSSLSTEKDVLVAFREEMCNTKFTTQFFWFRGNLYIRNACNCRLQAKTERNSRYHKTHKDKLENISKDFKKCMEWKNNKVSWPSFLAIYLAPQSSVKYCHTSVVIFVANKLVYNLRPKDWAKLGLHFVLMDGFEDFVYRNKISHSMEGRLNICFFQITSGNQLSVRLKSPSARCKADISAGVNFSWLCFTD